MIVSHEYQFIFIGVPRTGTYTIRLLLDAYSPHSLMPAAQDFTLPMGHEHRVDHATVTELRAHLGDEVWQTYYKFSFVRNPWDRVVSWFHSAFFKRKDLDFTEWLTTGGLDHPDYGLNHIAPAAHFLLNRSGELDVNFVGRFENYEADLRHIFEKLDIPILQIPKINFSQRPDYRELYTPETREVVAQFFADDIRLFNYSF